MRTKDPLRESLIPGCNVGKLTSLLQWGEQVFDTLPILKVFLLTKHVEVCNHRYTSTVRDGI